MFKVSYTLIKESDGTWLAKAVLTVMTNDVNEERTATYWGATRKVAMTRATMWADMIMGLRD